MKQSVIVCVQMRRERLSPYGTKKTTACKLWRRRLLHVALAAGSCFHAAPRRDPITLPKFTFTSQENGQLAERRATEHFERLFEALQERKSEMLRSIEQSRSRRMDQLKVQVRRTREPSRLSPEIKVQ